MLRAQVSGRALIPPLSLDELELDADIRPLSTSCGPAEDCLNPGDAVRVCHGPISVAASNTSVVTFSDPWPYNTGAVPWVVIPTGTMTVAEVSTVGADLGECPAGVACAESDQVAAVSFVASGSVEAAPLCVSFESKPYRLMRHLNVSVRTLRAVSAGSGRAQTVISGVRKRLYFQGDGLTSADAVKFVQVPVDVNTDTASGSPGVSHAACGAAGPATVSADLVAEVGIYYRVSGVTSRGRTFVDVVFNASAAGAELVVCYSFHDEFVPAASPVALYVALRVCACERRT